MAGDATPRDGATTRLARRLSVGDAVFIGLGSMIGAGIFTALAPAADAAGAGAIAGLVVAACVASLNALSSAQLARLHPESGGTYVYARERLGDIWAWIAGWSFVVGKFASCAAVALTFGSYLAPGYARYLAAAAVIAFTALNYRGIEKTAGATKVLVLVVLSALLCIVVLMLGGAPDPGNLGPLLGSNGVYGVLQSAGIWFFAFAGYSRIATLGEEVRDPRRSIPRAIVLSLGVTCAVYAAVVVSALLVAGPEALAASDAPLVTAVTAAAGDPDSECGPAEPVAGDGPADPADPSPAPVALTWGRRHRPRKTPVRITPPATNQPRCTWPPANTAPIASPDTCPMPKTKRNHPIRSSHSDLG